MHAGDSHESLFRPSRVAVFAAAVGASYHPLQTEILDPPISSRLALITNVYVAADLTAPYHRSNQKQISPVPVPALYIATRPVLAGRCHAAGPDAGLNGNLFSPFLGLCTGKTQRSRLPPSWPATTT